MRVKSRRPAREAALKALYQIEIAKSNVEDAVAEMRENATFDEDLVAYSEGLIRGVTQHAEEIKTALEAILEGWDFGRLAAVDRNLLRIGTYELTRIEEVPPAVAMNEAIELAKKYSTAESGKFINGILAKLCEVGPRGSNSMERMSQGTAPEEMPEEAASLEAPIEETIQEDSPEWQDIAKIGAIQKTEGEDPI